MARPTHERAPPALRQQVFDRRRKMVKPKSSTSTKTRPLKTSESQNTLTQMPDFKLTTSSSSAQLLSEIEDSEYEQSPPKKRRRVGTRQRGLKQTTYTQFDRSRPAKSSKEVEPDVSAQGRQIWVDDEAEADVEAGKADADVDTQGWQIWETAKKSVEDLHDRVETRSVDSGYKPFSRPSTGTANGLSPAFSTRSRILNTPKKIRFTEIPSSQSPASELRLLTPKHLLCSTRCDSDAERSPFKEISGNLQASPNINPDAQNVGKTVLCQPLSARAQGLKEDAYKAPPSETVHAVPDPDKPVARRSLKRVTTVQDSVGSDVEDDGDLDTTVVLAAEGEELDGAEASDEDDQATFDPAYSALDRDAARFGWTQVATQSRSKLTKTVVSDSEDEDELNEGGAALAVPAPQSPREQVSSTADAEAGVATVTTQDLSTAVVSDQAANSSSSIQLPPPDSETQSIPQPTVHMPSSPPALRPSQISTVASSPSASPSRVRSSQPIEVQGGTALELTPALMTSLSSFPLPPQSTLSSSPIVLPSWSYTALSNTHPRVGQGVYEQDETRIIDSQDDEHRKPQSYSLLPDFSLPPPPPMSSSSARATGAGSSPPVM